MAERELEKEVFLKAGKTMEIATQTEMKGMKEWEYKPNQITVEAEEQINQVINQGETYEEFTEIAGLRWPKECYRIINIQEEANETRQHDIVHWMTEDLQITNGVAKRDIEWLGGIEYLRNQKQKAEM